MPTPLDLHILSYYIKFYLSCYSHLQDFVSLYLTLTDEIPLPFICQNLPERIEALTIIIEKLSYLTVDKYLKDSAQMFTIN